MILFNFVQKWVLYHILSCITFCPLLELSQSLKVTDILLLLKMETIPEPIRRKLIDSGYDSLDKLPNDKDVNRWNRVQTRCVLDDPEVDQVMNIRFPVQQGNLFIS